jgi:hypothetical protein
MGESGGVYFYDQSALIRLLKEGSIKVHKLAPNLADSKTSLHSVKLRAGKTPTSEELLKELKDSVQLRLHLQGWELGGVAAPISENFCLLLPEFRRRSLSWEEQFDAMGFSPEQIEKIMLEMSAPSSSMLSKAIAALKPKQYTEKQRPNDICACNSGLKYKKCCGRPC